MNDFDQAARYAARVLDPPGFLLWLLGKPWFPAWRWASWLDTQTLALPGEPELRCDTVAQLERVAGDWPPVAVVIEFMSEPRWVILERLAAYSLRVRQEKPYHREPTVAYDVVGVVVNLTGGLPSGNWQMAPPDCEDLGLWLRAGLRNLAARDAALTLADIVSGQVARCVLPWLPLMRGGDDAALVAGWRQAAEAEPDPGKRADYVVLALAFADLAERREIWKTGLEGWDVRTAIVFDEARAEGRIQGELSTSRAKLMRVLEVRFGPTLAEDLVQAVQGQQDLATLDRWFDQALTAGNLDEVRTALALKGNGAAS